MFLHELSIIHQAHITNHLVYWISISALSSKVLLKADSHAPPELFITLKSSHSCCYPPGKSTFKHTSCNKFVTICQMRPAYPVWWTAVKKKEYLSFRIRPLAAICCCANVKLGTWKEKYSIIHLQQLLPCSGRAIFSWFRCNVTWRQLLYAAGLCSWHNAAASHASLACRLELAHRSAVKEAVEAWSVVKRCCLMKRQILLVQHKRNVSDLLKASVWHFFFCVCRKLKTSCWGSKGRRGKNVKADEEKVLP